MVLRGLLASLKISLLYDRCHFAVFFALMLSSLQVLDSTLQDCDLRVLLLFHAFKTVFVLLSVLLPLLLKELLLPLGSVGILLPILLCSLLLCMKLCSQPCDLSSRLVFDLVLLLHMPTVRVTQLRSCIAKFFSKTSGSHFTSSQTLARQLSLFLKTPSNLFLLFARCILNS